MTWEKSAFEKICRLGSICMLPLEDGHYLMQKDPDGGIRPAGGGKERQDADLEGTMLRELGEEFDLKPKAIKKKLTLLGTEYRAKFRGNHVFELKDHGLKPGIYVASNDVTEKIRLVKVKLDHPSYTGPDPKKLIKKSSTLEEPHPATSSFLPEGITPPGVLTPNQAAAKQQIDAKHDAFYQATVEDPTKRDLVSTDPGVVRAPEEGTVASSTWTSNKIEGAKQAGQKINENTNTKNHPDGTVNPASHWGRRQFNPKSASTVKSRSRVSTAAGDGGVAEKSGGTSRNETRADSPAPGSVHSQVDQLFRNVREASAGIAMGTGKALANRTLWAMASEPPERLTHEDDNDLQTGLNREGGQRGKEGSARLHSDGDRPVDPRAGSFMVGANAGNDRRPKELDTRSDDKGVDRDNTPVRNTVPRSAHGDEHVDRHMALADAKTTTGNEAGQGDSGSTTPLTGPEAIGYALNNLDMAELEKTSMDVVHRKLKSKRPAAIKVLGYLEGFKRSGLHPRDLMIHNVPVIPPQFRPYTMAGETFVPGDANELYRDLINLKGVHQDLESKLGVKGAAPNRLNIYDATKALYGFGEPTSPKTRERSVTGFLQKITGVSPKFSFGQRRLLSRNVDFTGRGVIAVNPDLGLDSIGMPSEMAWKLFSPYVQRRLVQSGMRPSDAVRHIGERSSIAEKMLDAELKERPVMASRSPAWHKFNAIGGWVTRVPGDSIQINPFVTTGLGADFDGDTMSLHVPSLHGAVEDVKNLLMPSKMLFSIKTRDSIANPLKHETLLALFTAQQRPAKNKYHFATQEEALAAIRNKSVKMSDEITIGRS